MEFLRERHHLPTLLLIALYNPLLLLIHRNKPTLQFHKLPVSIIPLLHPHPLQLFVFLRQPINIHPQPLNFLTHQRSLILDVHQSLSEFIVLVAEGEHSLVGGGAAILDLTVEALGEFYNSTF